MFFIAHKSIHMVFGDHRAALWSKLISV